MSATRPDFHDRSFEAELHQWSTARATSGGSSDVERLPELLAAADREVRETSRARSRSRARGRGPVALGLLALVSAQFLPSPADRALAEPVAEHARVVVERAAGSIGEAR